MNLSDAQIQLIQNVISGIIGAGTSLGVQWISKKKTKAEAKDTHTENVLKGSDEVVKAANQVVDMLQEVLTEERKNFRIEIERVQSACNQQIAHLTAKYDAEIKTLRDDNKALNIRVSNLSQENEDLRTQVTLLTNDNKELKKRLSKYENGTTGDHKAVKP